MSSKEATRRRSHRGRTRLLLAVAIGFVLWWLNQTIAQWSDRTWVFTSAVAFIFLLILLAAWALSAAGPPLYRFVRSVARSTWAGASADPEVRAFAESHPRLSAWLVRRTTLSAWSGIYLTLSTVAVVYFLFNFVSIARRASATSILTAYDNQISALLRAFRTPNLTRILWFFTVLGDPRVAFSVTAIVVLLLLLWGRRLDALLVTAAVAGGALLGEVAKLVFHKSRPDAALALIKSPSSFSLPSGHALYALLFWGAVGYLLVRTATTTFRKVAVFVACATVVVMTGLSRIYLGVHWPSDVLASWMLALAWLSACVGAYLMWQRYGTSIDGRPVGTPTVRWGATTGAVLLVAVAVIVGASADPILKKVVASPPTVVWKTSIDPSRLPQPTPEQAQTLPHVSQKLDGTPQAPIGLIFVGSERDLVDEFTKAGWSVADKPSPRSLLRALVTAYSDQPYPTAPVTPSFLNGRVEDIAFEKPEGPVTVRRRHHSRWWKTDFTFQGRPVWVATASFDESLGVASTIPILTHHISPNIDAEQRYIAQDLKTEGATISSRVRVSPPAAGTNAGGDQWFTQGLATVLVGAR